MKSHAPENYMCPICLGVKEIESSDTLMKPTDIVYKDDLVTAFINSFFVGKNAGHVIVVPNEHFESLYTLPVEYGHRIFDVAKKIALAMKDAYNCDGITTRQNNEPAGDQHAFHFHFHIFHGTRMMATMQCNHPRSAWRTLKNEKLMLKRLR